MYIEKTKISVSPLNSDFARLSSRVSYDDGEAEDIWVDVPVDANFSVDKANAWVVMMLPLAAVRDEDIEAELPVDAVLLENLYSIQRIWGSWYKNISPVEIICETITDKVDKKNAVGCFFSGGVDSFFSVLRRSGEKRISDVDCLIPIWGMDIPLYKKTEFDEVVNTASAVAEELGLEVLPIATNLRETRFDDAPWGRLSHGCALAAVALIVEDKFGEVVIGSTHTIPDFQPWGSHYFTDQLLSTSGLKFIHDGANFTRVEKTQFIASSPFVMNYLRVCWREASAKNCCKCGKCIRTMATLYSLNRMCDSVCFERSFDVRDVGRVFLANKNDVSFFDEIVSLAKKNDDKELLYYLEKSKSRSRFVRAGREGVDFVRRFSPLKRFSSILDYYLLKGMIQ